MKKRLLAVVMALAMVLAYMPAMAYAAGESGKVPQELNYSGAEFRYLDGNDYFDGFFENGNSITIDYGDTTETYEYVRYDYEESGDSASWSDGYFLNGDINNEDAWFTSNFDPDTGKVTITFHKDGLKLSKEYQARPYEKPVKVEYAGTALRYEPGDSYIYNLFNIGNKIIVTYDNNTTKTYICKQYTDKDEVYREYFLDGNVTKDESGDYNHVFISHEWDIRRLGTTEVDLTYQEYVGGGDEITVPFKAPIKYIIFSNTIVKKLTPAKKAITVKWNKATNKASGYEIQYSTSKSFKSAKKKTVKGKTKTSVKISKLKAKKTYYVRIRTYMTSKGKKYYSEWSIPKKIKTK